MLVELGSAMLCVDLGIVPELEVRPDHAAYIQSWAAILGSDKRATFQTAAQSQHAVAYLHDLQPKAETGAAGRLMLFAACPLGEGERLARVVARPRARLGGTLQISARRSTLFPEFIYME